MLPCEVKKLRYRCTRQVTICFMQVDGSFSSHFQRDGMLICQTDRGVVIICTLSGGNFDWMNVVHVDVSTKTVTVTIYLITSANNLWQGVRYTKEVIRLNFWAAEVIPEHRHYWMTYLFLDHLMNFPHPSRSLLFSSIDPTNIITEREIFLNSSIYISGRWFF